MTYHIWGDKWFEENGEDLYRAMNYIWDYTKRWSGCSVMFKEKYGTVRYEFLFPPWGTMKYGGYGKLPKIFDKKTSYGRIPRYLWYWNSFNPIYRYWARYGKWTLARAIKKACKKWPNVADELTADFDLDYM